MAERVGHGAGLLVAALGTAVIVASLAVGGAAAFLRPRPDLTDVELRVVAPPTEGYAIHVTGPVERWYSIPLLTMDEDTAMQGGPAAWTITVNPSSTVAVYANDCSFRGRLEGPWGGSRQTLVLEPQPAVQAGDVPATNVALAQGDRWPASEVDVRNPPCAVGP